MHIPVMADFAPDFPRDFPRDFQQDFPLDFEDESEVEQCTHHHSPSRESESGEGSPVENRGNGGCIRDRPVKVIPCPRCQSMNTKFCYYNNYSVNQPRHFCRNCQRYWTVGGTLRNVPVGGGSRKKTRTRSRNDAYLARSGDATAAPSSDALLSANSCMQQLAMLPPTLGGFTPFPTNSSQLPFLQFAMEQVQGAGSLFPQMPPKGALAGLQEVPDLQAFYDAPQVPQSSQISQISQISPENSGTLPMINSNGFFLPDVHSGSDALAAVMAKAGLWGAPAQQMHAPTSGLTPTTTPWEDRSVKANSQLGHFSAYEERRSPVASTQMNATVLPQGLKQAGFWETALMHSRPVMDDRLVPHVNSSWDVSPNSSTTEEERCPPSNCFGYHEDAVSQPWVGLQASDTLF